MRIVGSILSITSTSIYTVKRNPHTKQMRSRKTNNKPSLKGEEYNWEEEETEL